MATGPGGQAVVATTDNTVYGIHHTDIPAGQQDLYILKSQVVPPVCPACPVIEKESKCQPCAPCGRCPEPTFSCKKVPNYDAIGTDALPMPYLNSFSSF